MSCDLHIHSTCSDGAVPIERLASIAARTGLHAIALSDHDTLLSAQYAYAHTGQDGVELIPAVELTGYDFERQHRVHLLCYYPDVDCPALREHCAIMKERRNACALQSAKELEQLYPQFTTDLAWETTKASGVLFKSGLMQALELLGLTDGSIYGETYHKLFGWNPRGIVLHSPEYLPVRQVLATAKASGGAVVFAHPTVYKSMPLLRELAAENPKIILHKNIPDMWRYMQQCEAAVSAGGTTLLELCACGIPTVCFAFADNQLEFAEEMAEHNLLIYAGDVREKDDAPHVICENLVCYTKDAGKRALSFERMRRLVDGKGAERIAAFLQQYKRDV